MQMFVRTLHKPTAVSSACSVLVDCDGVGGSVSWLCVCRPRGYVDLWCETNGQLSLRVSLGIGEAVQLVALPAQRPGFLAIDADARVNLVTLHKGDTGAALPTVRGCGSLDLAADRQLADGASISGVVCSQAILLNEAPALAFQSTAAQQSRAAMQPDAAPELGPKTAAASTAGQTSAVAALQPSSSFSSPPADPDASGSESNDRLSEQQDTLADVDMDPAEERGSGQGQTVTALGPKAAHLLTALCIRQGFLHLLEIGAGSEAEFTLLMVPIPPLPIGNRIGGNDGRHDEVLALQLLKRKEKGTRIIVDLVFLCSATGGPGNSRPQRYLRLARMRFDSLTPSAGPAINWSVEAPFFNRVVDFTASLLQAAGESLLTISQRQVLIHTRGLMGELACNLPALPVTAVLALPNLHIIADASGGLHVMDSSGSQHSWRLRPINCGLQLSVAVALCFIPSSGTSNGPHAGWLFVGSHTGDSQILAAPRQLADELAAGMPISDAALQWQVVDPHAIENLAPVQDQLAFGHPSDSSERQLALCCGAAPTGTLRIANIGVGLLPRVQLGMGMEAQPSLWAVQHPAINQQPFLVLSSELAGATSLLEITGTQVQPAGPVSALQLDGPTLLVANVQDCTMLQVTMQQVLAMPLPRAQGPVVHWEPPAGSGPITMAALQDCNVVVACGSQLHHLQMFLPKTDIEDEELHSSIKHICTVSVSQQIAALTVFEAQGRVYAMIGTWVSNEVELLLLQHPGTARDTLQSSAPDERATATPLPMLRLPSGTPRSLLVRQFQPDAPPILFVGSSVGEVVFCTLELGSASAIAAVGCGRVVQAGMAEVQLLSLPAGVLAISDQALLFHGDPEYQPSSAEASGQQPGPLRSVGVQRVHASSAMSAAAGMGSAAQPNLLAWLTDRELVLGALDPEVRLRWQTAPIGDTPLHIASLPSSSTLLLATHAADGTAWLRLFQSTTLRQLAEVQLRQGQQHTALHAGQVPIALAGSRLAVQASDGSLGAQQNQRFAEGALDLAIVAHHEPATLLQQAAAAGGSHAPTALSWLSFFTVQHSPCEDAAEDQYELQLVVRQQLPSICHALTLLQPGSNSSKACQLAAACHGRLQVYTLHVTTTSTPGGGLYDVSLQQLYQLDGGLGCVAMLRALDGGELAAGPLLGSVVVCGADTTSAQAKAAAADLAGGMQLQQLRPRSADVSGMYAVDCLPLTHNRLLVAAHPSGLVLMHRYRDYEVEAEAEAARRVQQAAEAGQDRSAGTAPEQQPSLVPLGLEGGCRTQHNIVGLARGRLGVPVARLPGYSCLQPIGLGTAGSADPCLQQTNEADCRECALFTSRDGAVGLIQELDAHQYEVLHRSQVCAQHWRSSCQTDAGGSGHQAAWTLHSHDEEDMAVNLCSFIDGDLLAAALKDRPREASQAEEACANGTPSLVYQLSLGMV